MGALFPGGFSMLGDLAFRAERAVVNRYARYNSRDERRRSMIKRPPITDHFSAHLLVGKQSLRDLCLIMVRVSRVNNLVVSTVPVDWETGEGPGNGLFVAFRTRAG